jgi:hypothetical protein
LASALFNSRKALEILSNFNNLPRVAVAIGITKFCRSPLNSRKTHERIPEVLERLALPHKQESPSQFHGTFYEAADESTAEPCQISKYAEMLNLSRSFRTVFTLKSRLPFMTSLTPARKRGEDPDRALCPGEGSVGQCS